MKYKKFKPYFYKSKVWKRISIGIDSIFSLTFYTNGIMFTLCYFGTIQKRVEYEIELYPKFYFNKRRY